MDTVIISGSRTIADCDRVLSAFNQAFAGGSKDGLKIISGGAKGVDECAEQVAERYGIEYEQYDAEWEMHGNHAGPMRNQEMAEDGDVLVAVWDGESDGTYNMIQKALHQGLEVYVTQVER